MGNSVYKLIRYLFIGILFFTIISLNKNNLVLVFGSGYYMVLWKFIVVLLLINVSSMLNSGRY